MHTHVHRHAHTCTHTCARNSRNPGRCGWPCPRSQAGAPSWCPTKQHRPEPKAPGAQEEGVGGTRAVTDTYRYSQDGRLDRGPFVLPAVYDQDEPDASILQAERRRESRSVRRRRMGLPCRPSPGRARGKPAPPVALSLLHTLPGAPLPGQHRASCRASLSSRAPSRAHSDPRRTDRLCCLFPSLTPTSSRHREAGRAHASWSPAVQSELVILPCKWTGRPSPSQ